MNIFKYLFKGKEKITTLSNSKLLKDIFFNDEEFQFNIVFIHHFKYKDYIALKRDELKYNLNFSKGFDSILLAINCPSVSEYKILEDGKYEFKNKTGFLGLPSYSNIIELFPLLSVYCYQSNDTNDLFNKIVESRNAQLIRFGETLKSDVSLDKINELINLLNLQETNPNIDIEKLDMSKLNINVLVLNSSVYETFYKNLIDKEFEKEIIEKAEIKFKKQ